MDIVGVVILQHGRIRWVVVRSKKARRARTRGSTRSKVERATVAVRESPRVVIPVTGIVRF